jgi:phospholipid/cholesterol/gamma-HCH transport system substrate-binding protein
MGELAKVLEPVSKGQGTMGRLLRDDSLYQDLATAIRNVSSTTAGLDGSLKAMREQKSVLGRIIEDPELGRRLDALVQNLAKGTGSLEQILAKINSGSGSVGMLIDDPSIAVSLRNIFTGVQENNLLLSVARHAEERGQEIRMRDEMLSRRASRGETERVQKGAEEPAAPRMASGPEDGGGPAPATSPAPPADPDPRAKTGFTPPAAPGEGVKPGRSPDQR